jgi:hypothetical protein
MITIDWSSHFDSSQNLDLLLHFNASKTFAADKAHTEFLYCPLNTS